MRREAKGRAHGPRPLGSAAAALAAALAAASTAAAAGGAGYLSPLARPTCLSSNFGEYRARHFHAGLDFSTGGAEGWEARAVADAEVWRVRAQVRGFGKSLYLRLADGRIAVYAHLAEWNEPIAAWVRSEQARRRQYEVDLYPPPGTFRLKRGETVGRTGMTGAGPAHLHFELRDRDDLPLNPALHGFGPEDRAAPSPSHLVFEPLDAEARVDGRCRLAAIALTRRDGESLWRLARTPHLRGRIGVSVVARDLLQGCGARLAPYRLELLAGEAARYRALAREASYERGPLVESAYRSTPAGRAMRLYLPPGLEQEFHDRDSGDGRLEVVPAADGGESGPDSLTVVVADAAGNEARIAARWLRGLPGPSGSPAPSGKPGSEAPLVIEWPRNLVEVFIPEPEPGPAPPRVWIEPAGEPSAAARAGDALRDLLARKGVFAERAPGGWAAALTPLPGGRPATVVVARGDSLPRRTAPLEPVWPLDRGREESVIAQEGAIRLNFPSRALLEDLALRVRRRARPPPAAGLRLVSDVFELEPRGTPFDQRPWAGLRASSAALSDPRVALYAWDEENRRWSWLGREANPAESLLGGSLDELAPVALLADETAPAVGELTAAPGRGFRARGQARPVIAAAVSDAGSGIAAAGVEMLVDGEWVPAEYDPEEGRVAWQPPAPLPNGIHGVALRVRDRAGNESAATRAFRVPSD